MSRPYRLQGEYCFYHVTGRGDDRKKIFISKVDYRKFLSYIVTAKEKFKFYLYAYCLMPNHYHLFLQTIQPNLSRIMHYINSSYTTYYNIKRGRIGHVFHGRYKSILVDEDSYFLELTRYIHLNPVKAKLACNPQDYKWSSFSTYIKKKKSDKYIDKEHLVRYIDKNVGKYYQFVIAGMKNTGNMFDKVYGGFLLGSEKFIKDKINDLKNQIETKDFAHKRELLTEINPEDIIDYVADKYGKNVNELCSKKGSYAIERKIALYITKRSTGLTNREIGQRFMISSTAVIKSFRHVEKLMTSDKKMRKDIEQILSAFSA